MRAKTIVASFLSEGANAEATDYFEGKS